MAVCPYCHSEFEKRRKDQIYCSAKHRTYASRARTKEAATMAAAARDADIETLIRKLAVIAPKTAKRMKTFKLENGTDCTEAALRLCLTAYQEAKPVMA